MHGDGLTYSLSHGARKAEASKVFGKTVDKLRHLPRCGMLVDWASVMSAPHDLTRVVNVGCGL